jgi:hypothetical protein
LQLLPSLSDVIGAKNVTILIVRTVKDTTNRESSLFGSIATPGGRCGAHAPWSDGTIYFDFGGISGSNRLIWSGYTKDPTVLEKWIFRAGDGGMQIWFNGELKAESTTPVTRSIVSDALLLSDGNGGSGGTGDLFNVNLFALFPEEISDSECELLTRSPYQILKPSIDTFVFLGGEAGGGDTEITATTDTFTLATYDATVANDINITATTDAYTLTAYDATIAYGINITATTDTFTLTTYSATVANDVNITATTDTFTLTSPDATVTFTPVGDTNIAAETQALTLTTYSATVSNDVNITATTDTFTVATHDATVANDVEISATTDTYTITTYNAAVAASKNISCNVQQLTLTTFDCNVSSVAIIGEQSTGGWYEPPERTKEDVRKERIKLGIIKPDTPRKTVIKLKQRIKKYDQISSEEIQKEEGRLENLLDTFLQQETKPTEQDIFTQIRLNLNQLEQQRQIEEQMRQEAQAQMQAQEEADIAFVMMTLIA